MSREGAGARGFLYNGVLCLGGWAGAGYREVPVW